MRNRPLPLDLIFILSLFLLFTITAVTTVLTGMKIYRHTTDAMEQNYETRTFSSYLTEKVRQNDVSGGISVYSYSHTDSGENEQITEALCLTNSVGDRTYNTYLYLYDGYLRELTVSSDVTELSGTAGQKILPAQAFSVTTDNANLLHISYVSESGLSEELFFPIHTQIGGAK